MATTINASATAGLVQTADTSTILQLQTGGTTAVTVDASQNVGLGVTPSAWAANPKAMQLGTGGAIAGWTGAIPELDVSCNVYYASSNYRYITTGKATLHVQYDGSYTWYTAASGTAGNAITLNTALNLNPNGALALYGASTSANGVGITFPATQSASSDVNTLDDYEEGTWTPAYSVASGSIAANSSTSGKYTKIGRVVYIWGYISYQSNSSASGAVTITGLPFTSGGGFGQSSNRSGGVYTIGNVFFGSNSPNFGNIPAGGTSIEPFISTATGGTGLTFANFSAGFPNSDQFIFAGQYTV